MFEIFFFFMMAKADQRRWQVWNNWTATWQIIEVFAERPRRTIGSANMVAVETLARRTGKGIGSCCSAAFDVWQRRGADKLAASPMHATVALLPVVSSHPVLPPPPLAFINQWHSIVPFFACCRECNYPALKDDNGKGRCGNDEFAESLVHPFFGCDARLLLLNIWKILQ